MVVFVYLRIYQKRLIENGLTKNYSLKKVIESMTQDRCIKIDNSLLQIGNEPCTYSTSTNFNEYAQDVKHNSMKIHQFFEESVFLSKGPSLDCMVTQVSSKISR